MRDRHGEGLQPETQIGGTEPVLSDGAAVQAAGEVRGDGGAGLPHGAREGLPALQAGAQISREEALQGM